MPRRKVRSVKLINEEMKGSMPIEHSGRLMRDRATGAVGRIFGACPTALGSPGLRSGQLRFRMSRADGTEVRAALVDVPSVEERAQYISEENRRLDA